MQEIQINLPRVRHNSLKDWGYTSLSHNFFINHVSLRRKRFSRFVSITSDYLLRTFSLAFKLMIVLLVVLVIKLYIDYPIAQKLLENIVFAVESILKGGII